MTSPFEGIGRGLQQYTQTRLGLAQLGMQQQQQAGHQQLQQAQLSQLGTQQQAAQQKMEQEKLQTAGMLAKSVLSAPEEQRGAMYGRATNLMKAAFGDQGEAPPWGSEEATGAMQQMASYYDMMNPPKEADITYKEGTDPLTGKPTTFAVSRGEAKPVKGMAPPKAAPLTKRGKIAADIAAGYYTEEEAKDLALEYDDDTFDKATKLRKEYMTDAKDFMAVRDAFGRIQASASDPSPAGDLSLIFNYMKVLDPGSVVRESEFATAAGAKAALETAEESGEKVPNFIYGAVNRLITGQILLSDQRNDFVNRANKLYGSAERQHEKRKTVSTNLAKKYKIDPDVVVVDIGLAEKPEAAPAMAQQPPGIQQPTLPTRGQAPQGATGWDTEKGEWVY